MVKLADAHILMLPDAGGSGPTHWVSRWASQMSTAHVVLQDKWDQPHLTPWQQSLEKAIVAAHKPVVLVGHGLGANLIVTYVHNNHDTKKITGAFLVAPRDPDQPTFKRQFSPSWRELPLDPLPFASMLINSSNNPNCSQEVASSLALSWGSAYQDAGEYGQLKQSDGFGPWPEGLWQFASLMKRLKV